MELRIQPLPGEEFSVTVNRTDRVESIQKRIEATRQIPAAQQRLLLGVEQLESRSLLADYPLTSSSVLRLIVARPDALRIYVENTGGSRIPIEVHATDSIRAIKQQLQSQEGIPVEEQNLFLMGVPLSDEETVAHLGIASHSTLHLSVRPSGELSIHVELSSGQRIVVQARPDDTLADLKPKIQNQTGVPEDSQSLYFGAFRFDETAKLWTLPIQSGVTFHLSINPLITIRTLTGKSVHVPFSPDDTVADLKETVYEATGVLVDQQRLVWSGSQLEDEALLSEYGIVGGSVVNLVLRLRG
jgi:ubiquitin-like protein Nedd8